MKKLIILFTVLSNFAFGQTQKSESQLSTDFNIIKNETTAGANTKVRIGTALDNINVSKVSKDQIKTINGTTLIGTGDITISGGSSYTASQGISLTTSNFGLDTLKVPYYFCGRQVGLVKFNGTKWVVDNTAYLNLNSISAVSPIIYNNTTGVFSSQAATTSQNGYLTSTDWNTFNAKISNATGLVTAGTNVTLTGTGTSGSPYVINSTAAGGGGGTYALPNLTKKSGHVLTDSLGGIAWSIPIGQARINPRSNINIFGTSFTSAQGITASKGWPSLIADYTECTFTNYAVGGTQWFTAVQSAYSNIPVTDASPAFVEEGFNDVRSGGATSKTLEQIKSGARAFLANQFLATAIPASSGSVTTTGTWTTPTLSISKAVRGLSGNIRQSVLSGATLSYTFLGESLVIGTFSTDQFYRFGGDFTVSIDGGTAISYTGKNKASGVVDVNSYRMGIVPNALVLKNLGSGSHTAVVTTISTDTTRIDYFGTLKSVNICQPVFMSAVHKMSAYGYAITAGVATINDSIMQVATAAQFSVANEFNGFPVYKVDLNNYLNVRTGIQSDSIHPNITGQSQMATGWITALAPGHRNTGKLLVLDDGGNNKAYLLNSAGVGALHTNRDPLTGGFNDVGKASSWLNLTSSSGDAHLDIYTSGTNNTTPVNTFSIDKYGQMVSKNAAVTARSYYTNLSSSTNLTWNYNIATNSLDNSTLPAAMIGMGGSSANSSIVFSTGSVNGALPIANAILDKSGNLSCTGSFVPSVSVNTPLVNVGNQTIKDGALIGGGITSSLQLQNSVTNGRTTVAIIPNGTSPIADLWLFASSDATTNYSAALFGYEAGSSSWAFNTLKGGTNTVKPIYFNATGNATLATANLVLKTTGVVQAVSDISVTDFTKGLVLKSPDGTCYRITVANGGVTSTASITCP